MSDSMTKDLANLLKTQQSLTEWLSDMGHDKSEQLRREDNEKRERLKKINRITGLPFDEPVQFAASDLAENSDSHRLYQHKHGQDLCALRLIPKKDGLPKLRMRGLTVSKAYEWFKEQGLEPGDYRADYVPHGEVSHWATIFIISDNGVFGEIIRGGHHQLTQGFHADDTPITFNYDFKDWQLSRDDEKAKRHLMKIMPHLHIRDQEVRDQLSAAVGAEFANEYMKGYFETTDVDDLGLWFIDYNKTLGGMYSDMQVVGSQQDGLVCGQSGSPGSASGVVRIVPVDKLQSGDFFQGEILVCQVTTPDYLPVMKKAAAIVTDQGGILSHAAIVARELGVPCIVGTGNATKALRGGQTVTVDADKGEVYES